MMAFAGIGCFKGTFSLLVKEDGTPYQAPPRCIAYVLWDPFRKEQGHKQEQQITVALGLDETLEWYNSFVMVPKHDGSPKLCIDPARLNQVIYRGPIFNISLN